MIKWIPFYRYFFHRKGHGIHSPFVFDLITNVIEQRLPFYGYKEIDRVRLHMQLNDQLVTYQNKLYSIRKLLRQEGISKKEGELLFRLANHYKPSHIVTVGSAMGLAPLYLTGYASHLHCISLEKEKEIADIAQKNSDQLTGSVQVYAGDYAQTLLKALQQFKQIDCIYFAKELTKETVEAIYHQCLPLIHHESWMVISGIHTSSEKHAFWEQLCNDPKITVSVDLYKLGLIFFRPKLHKRMYKSRFI